MTIIEQLKTGLDVATIANMVMVVGAAIVIYLDRAGRSKKPSRKSSKR
ncbi:MAG: hypothetical protein HYT10_01330 [Candidatus Levybacteria bacterium]|nr:hypothetical protein [Candidatus Levybacteria bacterium]